MKPLIDEKNTQESRSQSIFERLGRRRNADRRPAEPNDSQRYLHLWFECTNEHLSPRYGMLRDASDVRLFVCGAWPACFGLFQGLVKSDEADEFIILSSEDVKKATLRLTKTGIVVRISSSSPPVAQSANELEALRAMSAQSGLKLRKCRYGHFFHKYVKQRASFGSHSVLSCPVCFEPLWRTKADAQPQSSR